MNKPAKPYPDFPLYAHRAGQWAKKIRGRTRYFGTWDDWQAALDLYLEQRDALQAGREPHEPTGGLSVALGLDLFLSSKATQRDAGELSPRTYTDYEQTTDLLVAAFTKSRPVDSLTPADFEQYRATLADRFGPARLSREIVQARMVFKYLYDSGYIERPVRFGPRFKVASRRSLRLARAAHGPKLFAASEVRTLIKAADRQVRAMIYLGVNCGFGNHDCGLLELAHLAGTWHHMPRHKTGTPRRCPLWPETQAALKEVIDHRADDLPEEVEPLVFVTKYRASWYKETRDNPIAKRFRLLLDECELYQRGRTFYALRHTFETVAGETADQVAVDYVMGHTRDDMASVYREQISDRRLLAVTDYVRNWVRGRSVGRSHQLRQQGA